MINYVYCGNNPEQKNLAEGVLKYPFVKGCPIYDQDSSGDYGSKIVSGLTGKIFVQWMATISDLEKIAKPDWYFWVGQTYLNYLSKGHKPPDVKHISNCFRVQQRLFKEHGIESRVMPRIGKAAEIKKSFLGFEKIRVGILDAWHWSLNHEEICNDLKGFELLGVGQGEYKLHDKTLLDSEIKEKCPHINLCEFGLLDVDVVIAGDSESNINKCLRGGVPVVANPTMYALDLEKKYNCLSIVRGDWGDAVRRALSPQIINGRKQLVEFAKKYNIKHDVCGKVVVAVNPDEEERLDKICERGKANGLEGIEKIDAVRLKEIEPYVEGIAALWVPESGIIDFVAVTNKLAELITDINPNSQIVYSCEVQSFVDGEFCHSLLDRL